MKHHKLDLYEIEQESSKIERIYLQNRANII